VPGTAGDFPHGATLRRDGTAWILVEKVDRSLGACLWWGEAQGAEDLHVLAEPAEVAATLARRASYFHPAPTVWSVQGRDLHPAPATALPPEPALPPGHAELAPLILEAGAEPVVEHGRLVGEVRGLEVARVEDHEGEVRLSIGVGKHDRQARTMMSGALMDPAEATAVLRQVVDDVGRRRAPGAPVHPAFSLAPERWLRSVVVSSPERVGARELAVSSPADPRPNLLGRSPAPAAGIDGDGRPVVVVCSTGLDPELVPVAAEARVLAVRERPELDGARLVLVLPHGDDHRITHRLAERLTDPAQVRTVPASWRSLSV
jgi:hypothetical protein